MKICKECNREFKTIVNINGGRKDLRGRSFCLDCSPFGLRTKNSISRSIVAGVTEDAMRSAVVGAETVSDVIANLGLHINNGQYRSIKRLANRFGVELPQYDPGIINRRIAYSKKMIDEEYFVAGILRNGTGIKKRLLDLGIHNSCSVCGLGPFWNGRALTLQVDHIDGDRFNNSKINLRIICPNCHTQTDTYGNSGGVVDKNRYNYCKCGVRISRLAAQCVSCSNKDTKIKRVYPDRFGISWPDLEDVISMIKRTNFSMAAKKIGVSDNAIRRFLTRNRISFKTLMPIEK